VRTQLRARRALLGTMRAMSRRPATMMQTIKHNERMAFEQLIGRGGGIKRNGARTPRRRKGWPPAKTSASLRRCAFALSSAGLKSTAAGARRQAERGRARPPPCPDCHAHGRIRRRPALPRCRARGRAHSVGWWLCASTGQSQFGVDERGKGHLNLFAPRTRRARSRGATVESSQLRSGW
jgi:hypothetical protein